MIRFENNVDQAIAVMCAAGQWMLDTDKEVSKWWDLDNLNRDFLFQYAKREEFYVGIIDHQPVVAAILQEGQDAQDWKKVDGKQALRAVYIHWLCVDPNFAGKGLSGKILEYATTLAKNRGVDLLRVDTNANEQKLRDLYEKNGFTCVAEIDEEYRKTALYEKYLGPR